MNNKPVPIEPDYVACEVCLEEIPLSVAISHEADQYTQHFCGLHCYSLWREKQEIRREAQELR
ncbi:MAG: DUF3330 domain-containing protein [Gammaproteobacteria bacterium]|jgi:hypothetical protein